MYLNHVVHLGYNEDFISRLLSVSHSVQTLVSIENTEHNKDHCYYINIL